MNMNLVKSFIGNVPLEGLKYIDIYWGNSIMVSAPNGGLFDYVIQPHSHPTYFFAVFTNEKNYIKVNDNLVKVKPNKIFVLSPGVTHCEVPIDSQSRYFVVSVLVDKVEEMAKFYDVKLDYYEGVFFEDTENLLTYIYEYISESEVDSNPDSMTLNSLENILINKAVKTLSSTPDIEVPELVNKDIESSIKFIFNNLSKIITIEDLAEVANMSISHFRKKFKDDLGITPIKYINKVRMEKSSFLIIEDKLSVKEIASICGFSSISHFSSSFKKFFGVGPNEFSEKYKYETY